VIFLDAQGHVVAWLGAAEVLFGYQKAEALELEFADLFTPNDRRLQMDLQELAVSRALGRSEDERWHVRKDGTFFWASGVVAAVTDPLGRTEAFCKILRDRTDVRQQLDIQQNRVQAVQLENQRKSHVLESVGHQLRTLASSLDEAAEVSAGGPQTLQRRSRVARAKRLVELAAIVEKAAQSDDAKLLPKSPRRNRSIVLQEALKACIGSVRQSALADGQHLHLIAPSVALRLRADPAALREMVQALIANARKQTPSTGNIHITAGVEGASAVVRVVDDGVGMSARRMAKVLLILSGPDRVSKLEDSDAELAAIVDLVSLHGGSLEARSPGMGKGSQFCLRLPIGSV
jgi:two-component system CheB/CheR fusion protein